MTLFSRSRTGLAAALATLALGCSDKPVTESARQLTPEHRQALADSIRTLSDSVIAAGNRLDATAMSAPFMDGPDVAYGTAGALVLSGAQFRQNLTNSYRVVRGQRLEVIEQRVAVLGVDAAVTTGWGNFEAQDTAGTRARGLQAFTFAWARNDGRWRVVQAHFSSQLLGIQRPEGARRDSTAQGKAPPAR